MDEMWIKTPAPRGRFSKFLFVTHVWLDGTLDTAVRECHGAEHMMHRQCAGEFHACIAGRRVKIGRVGLCKIAHGGEWARPTKRPACVAKDLAVGDETKMRLVENRPFVKGRRMVCETVLDKGLRGLGMSLEGRR